MCKKPEGRDFFLLAQKAKAKMQKGAMGAIYAKFAKKAKMANRACNGRDKSSVKYGPMCYATFEV